MENKQINPNQTVFEQIKEVDENGNEFWGARKLSKILEYTDFRNFQTVVAKAKEACKNSGRPVENHIVDFNEMVPIGSAMRGLQPRNSILSPPAKLVLKTLGLRIITY
jgi:DNA-damage-inducible protein D